MSGSNQGDQRKAGSELQGLKMKEVISARGIEVDQAAASNQSSEVLRGRRVDRSQGPTGKQEVTANPQEGTKQLVEKLPNDPRPTVAGENVERFTDTLPEEAPENGRKAAKRLVERLPGNEPEEDSLKMGKWFKPDNPDPGDRQGKLPPADDNVDDPVPQKFDEGGRWHQEFDTGMDGREFGPN